MNIDPAVGIGARVLMIDNYDSFTYNLVQLLLASGAAVVVKRNDEVTVQQAARSGLTHLVISPGPGGPHQAGVSMAMIEHFAPRLPVLGVCLGHQAIAEVFGGVVRRAPRLMHGKPSMVTHDGTGLFASMSSPFQAGRYHSLAVAESDLPADLVVSARTEEGEVMGIRHKSLLCEGVQFHPESVLTPEGPKILENFLRSAVVHSTGPLPGGGALA